MATRQRNTNPFMSANLGSGARTTTGGTYENPRLGIQDYSAFGKGVASSLVIPQEEEDDTELLVDDPGTWDVEKNGFFIGGDGVYHDLDRDAFTIANNNFFGKGGEVERGKADWKKSKRNKKKQNEISTYFSGYADLNNMGEALDMTEDSTNDSNISVYFPDVNGDKTNISMADLARITRSNSNSLKITTKYNKSGIPQKGYLLNTSEGEVFLNATAMDDEWRKNNFAVKFNRNNVLNTARDNYRKNYVTDFYQENDTYTDPNNKTRTIKESDKYVQNKSIAQHNEHAMRFANDTFNENSYLSSTFQSSWYQLSKAVKNGGFSFNERSVEDSKALVNNLNNNGSNSEKLELLKDYYAEQYKLQNASEAYVISNDEGFGVGRAIPKTIENEQFWNKDIARSERTQTGTNINVNVGGSDTDPITTADLNAVLNPMKGFVSPTGTPFEFYEKGGPAPSKGSWVDYKGVDLTNPEAVKALGNSMNQMFGNQDGQLVSKDVAFDYFKDNFMLDAEWNTEQWATWDDVPEDKKQELKGKFNIEAKLKLRPDSELIYVSGLEKDAPSFIPMDNLSTGDGYYEDIVKFLTLPLSSTNTNQKKYKNALLANYRGSWMETRDKRVKGAVNLPKGSKFNDLKEVKDYFTVNGEFNKDNFKKELNTINVLRNDKGLPPIGLPANWDEL